MAGAQRTLLLLLLFVGTMFLAISLAGADDPAHPGCGSNCDCPNKQSCTSGAAKDKCCWSDKYGCKEVYFQTDEYNCGKCNNQCNKPYETCCSGICCNLKTSNFNCGSCGHKCEGGKVCKFGYCKW